MRSATPLLHRRFLSVSAQGLRIEDENLRTVDAQEPDLPEQAELAAHVLARESQIASKVALRELEVDQRAALDHPAMLVGKPK